MMDKTNKNMKLEIAEKAYELNLDKIEGGEYTTPCISYAETRGKAKNEILEDIKYASLRTRWTGEEIDYTNVPVRRAKQEDIVLFEGRGVKRWRVADILSERVREVELDELLNNPDVEYCYIYKGSYYRPNSAGYTDFKTKAGVYTKQDAVRKAKHCNKLRLEVVDIEEHNQLIRDEINELSTRLILD